MIDWLEAHMGTCVFVKYFNIECPGCGLQRAFIALLRGEFILSLKLFPALIPYLSTILLLLFQLIFGFKRGGGVVMFAFIASITIMVAGFIIKLMA